MERLEEQFDGAPAKIEVSGPKRDRAIEAHEEMRGVLEADPKLQEWGIETVLIGSYARHTGIYPGKDVDVFVKLTKLTTESTQPAAVYNRVRDVLVDQYGDRAKPQARSIKVVFVFDYDGDGFAVDAVPAVRMGARWGIPRRKTELWESPDVAERWVETDPEKLAELTTKRNKSPKVGNQGAYVPTVKLVRQTRRHHLLDQKPGGLYFEILTFWAFQSGAITGDCYAEILAQTLRAVATQLGTGGATTDPVLERPYEPEPERDDLENAAETFDELAAKAEEALRADKCKAAALWRDIFGKNGRGWVFGLPAGCDEQGNKVPVAAAVAARGSREASPFA
jgi:Second Messenger Oligonucleotide or Dinucleotide Synthetase domain